MKWKYFYIWLVLMVYVCSSTSFAMVETDIVQKILIIQKSNDDFSSKVQRETILKTTSYLSGQIIRIGKEFILNNNKYVFNALSIDNGTKCNEELQNQNLEDTVLILGAITSNCTLALINDPLLVGIPILNSFSTKDQLNYSNINSQNTNDNSNEPRKNAENFFRTVFSDKHRVDVLVREFELLVGNEDIRLLKLKVIYDSKSEFSKGLKKNITAALGGRVNKANVTFIDVSEDSVTCDNIFSDTGAVVFTSSKISISIYESLVKCYLGKSQVKYYGFGGIKTYPYFPIDSTIISIPTLSLYQNTSIAVADLYEHNSESDFSLPSFMVAELLVDYFDSIVVGSALTTERLRENFSKFLAHANSYVSQATSKTLGFNKFGDIDSDIIRASIYKTRLIYELDNGDKNEMNEVGARFTKAYIGFLDGEVQLEIFPSKSMHGKDVEVRVTRVLPNENMLSEIINNFSARTKKLKLSGESITTFKFIPSFTGDYEISILKNDKEILIKRAKISVGFPMNLLLSMLVALIVVFLTLKSKEKPINGEMEEQDNKTDGQSTFSIVMAAIFAAFILYLITVTLRNSGLPNVLPFISFSEDHTINGIMVGIIAGTFGMSGIREFFVRLSQKFNFKGR